MTSSVRNTSSDEIRSGHGTILTTTQPKRQVSQPLASQMNWPMPR